MIMAEFEHVDEQDPPPLERVKEDYIDQHLFTDSILGLEHKSAKEYGEEFDNFIEGIRSKAWLEGFAQAQKLAKKKM